MIRVTHKIGKIEVTVEGKTIEEAFEELSHAGEAFGSTTCGACGLDDTAFITRKNGKYTFHEIKCRECNATLTISKQTDTGVLYPRRKDKEGNRLENGGWVQWKPDTSGGEVF